MIQPSERTADVAVVPFGAYCGAAGAKQSAKIVFEYEIRDKVSGETFATGRSVQVFTGFDHQLVLESPEFYRNWQKKWEVL